MILDHATLFIALAALVFLGVLLKPHPIPWEGKGAAGPAPASFVAQSAKWHQVSNATVAQYSGSGGYNAIPSSITLSAWHGFAGEPAFDSGSSNLLAVTQEGDTGIIKVPVYGTVANPFLTGYTVNNYVYSNPYAAGASGSYFAASNSISPQIQCLFSSSLSGVPGFPVVYTPNDGSSNFGNSTACRTDGTWVFAAMNDNPGAVFCVKISSPTTTLSWQSADSWEGGAFTYGLELDTTNKLFVAVSNNGNAYLVDYSPLYNSTPTVPVLKASGATFGTAHVGAFDGSRHRLYLGNGNTLKGWNTSTPTVPAAVGSTFTNPHDSGSSPDGFNNLNVDTTNHLLYFAYGANTNAAPGVLALTVASSDVITELAGSPFGGLSLPNGSGTVPAIKTALSGDVSKYAIAATAGGNSPGGIEVWNVSSLAGGGSATVVTFIPATAESRYGISVRGDTQSWVYDFSRFELQAFNAAGTLSTLYNDGNIWGNRALRIGVTSGQDPEGNTGPSTTKSWFLMCGAGQSVNNYFVQCSSGTFTRSTNVGNVVILDAYWSGKYLYAMVNNQGVNGQAYLWICPVTYSTSTLAWTVGGINGGSKVASWLSPNFTAGGRVTCFADGEYGTAGSVCYIAYDWNPQQGGATSTGQGVHCIDISNGSSTTLAELTTGSFPDPVIATPAAITTFTIQSGGNLDSNFTYAFQAFYYLANGTVCGISTIGANTYVATSNQEVVLTGFPTPPTGAASMSVGGAWIFGNNNAQNAGVAVIPEGNSLAIGTTNLTVYSAKETWSGSYNTLPTAFTTEGNCMSIVKAQNIIYVTQGYQGIRAYYSSSKTYAGQITSSGDSNPTDVNVASTWLAVASQGGSSWLCSTNYSTTASNNAGQGGYCFYNVSSSATNPPVTYVNTPQGFTVFSDDTIGPNNVGVVLANSLSGPIGFQYS